MAFDPTKPAVGNAGLADIAAILENLLQLRKHEIGAAAPTNLVDGIVWVDSNNELIKIYLNGGWVSLFDYSGYIQNIENLSIDTTKIANLAVTTAKIANSNITTTKIASLNVTEGKIATGAVTESKLGSSAVDQTALKTGTNSSISGTLNYSTQSVNCSMQDYCFFPNIYTENSFITVVGYPGISAVYTGRFKLRYDEVVAESDDADYQVRYRYVTATDKPFIYALIDKSTDKIKHIWAATDPPTLYWGLNKKPDNFEPPIILDEKNYLERYHELILFNYPLESYQKIVKEADNKKMILSKFLNKYYKFNNEKKLFVSYRS